MFTLARGSGCPHGRATVLGLSAGDAGTLETLDIMRGLVHKSYEHPEVKEVAVKATAGCPPNSPPCFANKIFKYAKANMRYVPDINGVEEVTAPWIHSKRILTLGGTYGDCDDFSVLQAAWLSSLGVPTRFAVIATPRNGGTYDHVRVEARILNRWVPMETTRRNSKLGEKMNGIRATYLEV
jgi:transglutaminase-like putative cysteine protease